MRQLNTLAELKEATVQKDFADVLCCWITRGGVLQAIEDWCCGVVARAPQTTSDVPS